MPSLEGAQSPLTAPLCLLGTVEFCAEYGASPQTPCYWLGPTEAGSILGFKISPTSLERPCLLSLEEWQGNGVCLLDIGLVAKGAVENPPESLTHLAHHPYRNRMAWVGGEDTMSIIPVLQTSGIPRYLNTGDVLAPMWLADWRLRLNNGGDIEAKPFPYQAEENAVTTWRIDSTSALDTTIHEVLEYCRGVQTQAVSELHTCLVEALTNALYHAPVTDADQRKYEKHQLLEALPAEDQVTVTATVWQGWVVLTITDHWGRLTAEAILAGLFHQTTEAGLLDEHGRGMLLMHLLPQGWANVSAPGQKNTTVFVHPTSVHSEANANPARSFWFIEVV